MHGRPPIANPFLSSAELSTAYPVTFISSPSDALHQYCLPFSLRPLLCGPSENLLPQPNLLIGPKPCLPRATAKLSSSFNPSYFLSLFLSPTCKARPWFTLSGSLTSRIIPQDSLCARDCVPGAQQCASTEISYSSFTFPGETRNCKPNLSFWDISVAVLYLGMHLPSGCVLLVTYLRTNTDHFWISHSFEMLVFQCFCLLAQIIQTSAGPQAGCSSPSLLDWLLIIRIRCKHTSSQKPSLTIQSKEASQSF